jgi:hypothetical protein
LQGKDLVTIAAHDARALGRVRSDRTRWELWVTNAGARLHLSPAEAERWLVERFEAGDRELAEAIACGALVEGGRVWWPDEKP